MSAFDDWTKGQAAAFAQGAGDVARSAWADIGNSYQQILTQDASIGPPTPVTGDIVTTHDPNPPEPLNDRELLALIDEQEFEARMATELEREAAQPEQDTTMDMDR